MPGSGDESAMGGCCTALGYACRFARVHSSKPYVAAATQKHVAGCLLKQLLQGDDYRMTTG